MKSKVLKCEDVWQEIKNSAMTTVGKTTNTYPSSEWKRKALLSEHSMIRKLKISAIWTDIKSWVSVHFVRHKIGIEHWVKTQRTDRTNVNRDNLPQGNLVNHEFEANAQAIINISRKRLCNQASKETREAWKAFLESIKDLEPELYNTCVPDCIYRGWCYEFNSCNYHKTQEFQQKLIEYRKNINT